MKNIPFTKRSGEADVHERLHVMNKKQRHAVLATDCSGQPYTSLVAFAFTSDCKGALFATPKKTTKYNNLLKNSNVSLLVDTRKNSARGYMESEAVTILGRATPVRRSRRRDELARLFTEKHRDLADFLNAPSTALVYIAFQKVIHAGTFQSITEWKPEQKK
jgi:nitroimidazol reductase NimA-like FMN-containing flavoprotein (pyridoxamine 5'-phosphate oxidase superfamily)